MNDHIGGVQQPSSNAREASLVQPNAEHVRGDALTSALRTLKVECDGISALIEALRNGMAGPFAAATRLISVARGRVVVTGMGKSGHIAHKIAATLASTGTPAFFVHPAEASHGDMGMITDGDVVVALSWSGETAELKNIIDYTRRFKIRLIAVTSDESSTLARAADVALTLPQAREACPHNLAPTTSSLMQLALGDALAVALLEGRGFTANNFGLLHPGGRLGAMLKFVRDVMRTGPEVPLVKLGTPVSEAVLTISGKALGCVGIIQEDGKLLGIITDGDLRRHMGPDLLAKPVEQIMTANPKTIGPDQLVSEAIESLNASKITILFVVDEGRPRGLVHIHDLLRVGAA